MARSTEVKQKQYAQDKKEGYADELKRQIVVNQTNKKTSLW